MKNLHNKHAIIQQLLTMGSLATVGSFMAGGLCFGKFPAPVTGPEFLLRNGSAGTQPLGGGRPSSPPTRCSDS